MCKHAACDCQANRICRAHRHTRRPPTHMHAVKAPGYPHTRQYSKKLADEHAWAASPRFSWVHFPRFGKTVTGTPTPFVCQGAVHILWLCVTVYTEYTEYCIRHNHTAGKYMVMPNAVFCVDAIRSTSEAFVMRLAPSLVRTTWALIPL